MPFIPMPTPSQVRRASLTIIILIIVITTIILIWVIVIRSSSSSSSTTTNNNIILSTSVLRIRDAPNAYSSNLVNPHRDSRRPVLPTRNTSDWWILLTKTPDKLLCENHCDGNWGYNLSWTTCVWIGLVGQYAQSFQSLKVAVLTMKRQLWK